ncbi:sorting nexin-4-like isoform X2 [Homalodisca vitripennis]|uniref:sorting nexin-4-like isoform X2 n=1 Tax=Homalodisca vitripennis TaxID=197043 RepID=UPI001EECB2B7|nr:sorting nexin-4-like isoform X2 [Homalodisca vitripennis]
MASSQGDTDTFSVDNLLLDNSRKQPCLLDHMEINITEAEKRANSALNIREYYTVYLIETKTLNKEWPAVTRSLGLLWRRYTEFEQLRAYLEVTYPWAIVPPLPEKRPLYTWQNIPNDTFDPDFVDRRRAGLENFLHRIAAHPILSKDQIFLGFLQQEEGWKETVKKTGYLQHAETKLRALSIGVRLKSADPRFDDIKSYATGLHGNLHNLLRIRAKLAAKLFSINKLHQGYGRVFSEWSVVEKDMGDGLQKSGHFFDSIAAGIGTSLEDEELVIDQLKEYLFFSGSLQALCRRQELLQYELEQAQENIKNKEQEKIRVQQGRSGLMSRLFGSVETEEVRDMKLNQLEARIQVGEQAVQDCKLALSDFSHKALQEFDGFQQKKVVDLRDTLATYMSLQIKMARKGLQTWTHIRECIENIP